MSIPQGQPEPQPSQSNKKSSGGKKGCLGCASVVGVFLVIGIAVAAVNGAKTSSTSGTSSSVSTSSGTSKSGGSDPLTSSGNDAHPPQADVKITSCSIDPTLNYPSAKVTITNHSSQPSDYMIQIEFDNSSGARVSDGYATENTVRPGQAVFTTAQGTDQVQGQVVCKAVSVDRTASAG